MRSALIFGLLLSASVPVHATTFGSGVVDAGALVMLDLPFIEGRPGPASIAGDGTINTSSSATLANGIYTASSFANVAATWDSADSGHFTIDWGWNVATGGSGLLTFVETDAAFPDPNWSYTFTASGNGFFDFNYSVVGFGDVFGLGPIFGNGDINGRSYGGDRNDPSGSGSFSLALLDGQTYTVGFFNNGFSSNNDGFNAVGHALARFDWQINYSDIAGPPVPEPGSWAMMMAGLGLVGVATRRANRRRAAAAA